MLVSHFPGAIDKATVIPNGVDLAKLRAAVPFAGDKKTIVSAGRLETYKHVEDTLRALARLGHDYQLVVIGAGPDRARLEAIGRELGLADRVRFLGRIGSDELYRWYRTADVYVTMSSNEAMGITILELLACGARVVASDIPAHREVNDRVGGVLTIVPRRCQSPELATPSRSPPRHLPLRTPDPHLGRGDRCHSGGVRRGGRWCLSHHALGSSIGSTNRLRMRWPDSMPSLMPRAVELEAWFSEVRQPDRSWDVDESEWRFPARYIPYRRFRHCGSASRFPNLPKHVPTSSSWNTTDSTRRSAQWPDESSPAGWPSESSQNFDAWSERKWWREAAKHLLFRAVDGVKVPGPDGRALALRYGTEPHRASVVRQSIDLALYGAARQVSASEREARRQ